MTPPPDPIPSPAARAPVNRRSVALGLAGVIFINAITPFNNHALLNTDLVGSYLPTGLLLFFMLFLALVNAPLHRYLPRHAFSSGELAVALGMTLVGCALPFVGLMRYLPGHLTSIFHYAAIRPEYADLLRNANLADWLFPDTAAQDVAARGNDPVIRDFVGRTAIDGDRFIDRLFAVPWSAWLTPFIAWGIFLVGLFGSVLCMMVVFRRQWAENERLQFPVATVFLALIEPPPKGRAFNTLFRSPLFWIGFAAVFTIHLINGLAAYHPRHVPVIPLAYDLNSILTEEPWRYVEWGVKRQQIFFTIIGLMMFVQTRTAFSLWFIYMLLQVARMAAGSQQTSITAQMEFDQLFGAIIVFAAMILWVARHHLAAVLRQMVKPPRPDDPQGRYLPYRLAGWGFITCQLILILWLYAAGAGLFAAIVIVGMLMLLYLVLAKVVADTGMIYALLPVPVAHPFDFLASLTQTTHAKPGSYFFASLFSGILVHDLRQALPPYAQHAMVVADRAAYPKAQWRTAIRFMGVLVFALFVAYVVAGASTLYVEYNYAATLDRSNASPINWWGAHGMVQSIVMDPAVRYDRGGTSVAHSRPFHLTIGAAITATLGTLRLSFAAFPLHPVGFLMCYTWGLRMIWFSIFLGWLAKVLLVKYGGAKLFTQSQPLFLGLILGEVLAAAFWLITSLALALLNYEYRAIILLP